MTVLPEAGRFKLHGHFDDIEAGVELLFGLSGRDVADGFAQPAVIAPVYPFQGSELDHLLKSRSVD